MTPPTVLAVTNDPVSDHNLSFGKGFAGIAEDGHLRWHAVTPLATKRTHGAAAALQELMRIAEDIRPDLLFVQPMPQLPWTGAYVSALLKRAGSPALVYWEGDQVEANHRPGDTVLPWYVHADTTYINGLGGQLRHMSRYTRHPRYVPHVIPGRLVTAAPIPPIAEAVYDAIHIGNCQMLLLGLYEKCPGARDRRRVVQEVSRLPGCRTAAYGQRWRGRSALGPLPFDDQVTAVRTARFSLNWEHFPGRYGYFSDRTPVSMYAGRPHITTRPGPVDWLPGPDQGLHLVSSPAEAVERARELLHTDDDTLDTMGRAQHVWVRDRLTERNALLHMLGPHLDLPAPPDDPWGPIAAMSEELATAV